MYMLSDFMLSKYIDVYLFFKFLILDNGGEEAANAGTYRAVSFSYGTTDVSAEHKNPDEAGFVPPFVVPEYLLQSLVSRRFLIMFSCYMYSFAYNLILF